MILVVIAVLSVAAAVWSGYQLGLHIGRTESRLWRDHVRRWREVGMPPPYDFPEGGNAR